jgi:hypothetical protein
MENIKPNYLSHKDVSDLLEEFEIKTNVLNYVVLDINVWQVIRTKMFRKLLALPLNKEPLPFFSILFSVIKGFFFWNLLTLRGSKKLVFTYSSGARIKNDKGFEDVWIDELLNTIPNGKKIIQLNAPGYFRNVFNSVIPPSYDCSVIRYLALILTRFFKVKGNDEEFKKLAILISNNLENVSISKAEIVRELSFFVWQSKLYEFMLRFAAPEMCYVTSTSELALLKACRRTNVPFIELQHGIYSKHHPNCFSGRHVNHIKNLLFPDYLAVYGEYWEKGLEGTLLHNLKRVIPIGNGLLERYRKQRLTYATSAKLNYIITITTQGLDQSNLIDFIGGFLKKSDADFLVYIKLHPAYDTSTSLYKVKELEDPRIRLVPGNSEPGTFDLLTKSNLHLSIASACHYDALSIGTPTGIIGLRGHDVVIDLAQSGQAFLFMNPEELVSFVNRDINENLKISDGSAFCSHNFSQHINNLNESFKARSV